MFEWHELPHYRIRSDITPTPLHNHAAREHYLSISPDISLVIPWFPPATGLAIANPVAGRGLRKVLSSLGLQRRIVLAGLMPHKAFVKSYPMWTFILMKVFLNRQI